MLLQEAVHAMILTYSSFCRNATPLEDKGWAPQHTHKHTHTHTHTHTNTHTHTHTHTHPHTHTHTHCSIVLLTSIAECTIHEPGDGMDEPMNTTCCTAKEQAQRQT